MNYSSQNQTSVQACISTISIEYRDGFYEVLELATAISKHDSLQEAQWVRSILERDLATSH